MTVVKLVVQLASATGSHESRHDHPMIFFVIKNTKLRLSSVKIAYNYVLYLLKFNYLTASRTSRKSSPCMLTINAFEPS